MNVFSNFLLKMKKEKEKKTGDREWKMFSMTKQTLDFVIFELFQYHNVLFA